MPPFLKRASACLECSYVSCHSERSEESRLHERESHGLECHGIVNSKSMLKIKLQNSVLTLTLNRPEVHNALNSELVSRVLDSLKKYENDPHMRIVVLQGAGKTFCSGGDIQWLKDLGSEARKNEKGKRKNLSEAKRLAEFFYSINYYPKPVVGCVKGSVMGGGFGLTSVCDYILAHQKTLFSLSELRMGIIPSVILPFVLAKIGESQTRALMMTGEKVESEKAKSLNLVHEIYHDENDLEKRLNNIVSKILKSAPEAVKRGKKLIQEIKQKNPDDIFDHVSQTLATVRAASEAQEGLSAFLEKRDPDWLK